jgi:hypothetical protein
MAMSVVYDPCSPKAILGPMGKIAPSLSNFFPPAAISGGRKKYAEADFTAARHKTYSIKETT